MSRIEDKPQRKRGKTKFLYKNSVPSGFFPLKNLLTQGSSAVNLLRFCV
jgi:hypothetical protein